MPYCRLDVNRAKCESYQVPVGTLFSTLQHYVGSYYVNDVNLGNQANRVVIQADENGRDSVEAVRRIFVKSQTGAMIPVDSLVSTEPTVDGRWCARYNKRLITSLTSVPKNGVSTGDAMRERTPVARSASRPFRECSPRRSWESFSCRYSSSSSSGSETGGAADRV